MKKLIPLAVILISIFTFAEGTRSWTQDSYDEFSHGTSQNVAISNRGAIELAPSLRPIYNTPSTFLWSLAAGKDGELFVGGGSPSRVYRVERDGNAQAIFEPKELQVQSLAMAGNTLYAATSPDGKIYKITASVPAQKGSTAKTYSATECFNPQTKYIWQLLGATDGTVYAATGDKGEIYRITSDCKGSVYFKSDEAHIRSLAFDGDGNIIAGTDGSGLIYRISKQGDAFVLFSTTKKEVTSIAVANDGTIYAAAVGDKRVGPLPAPQPQPATPGANPAPQPQPFTQIGGAEVYAIAPDGAPSRIWSSRDDLVYALGFDPQGNLLAGTGNKGRILTLKPNGDWSDVAKASANQVIAFASAGKDGTYAATSNLGKIYLLGAAPSAEGTFESEVLDAKMFSKWGRASVRGRGNYELAVRSGNVDNPDRNWSPWKTVQLGKDAKLDVPASRFLQWRATFKPATGGSQISAVTLYYLPKNIAPVVDDIVVQAGARLSPTAPSRGGSDTVSINFSQPKETPGPSGPRNEGSLNAQRERGYNTVRWAAHDDNDDDLVYSVYYRGENESSWKLLKQNVTDKYYSFDSGLMPDGDYVVRVIASDAPSHAPEEALTGMRDSTGFEVDNTPPQIESLAAKVDGDQLHVSFSAADATSPIERAEYSVDAGDWRYLEPVGQLSDAKVETYDFNVQVPPAPPKTTTKSKKKDVAQQPAEENPVSSEHVVVVRVYDKYDNSSVAKTVTK